VSRGAKLYERVNRGMDEFDVYWLAPQQAGWLNEWLAGWLMAAVGC